MIDSILDILKLTEQIENIIMNTDKYNGIQNAYNADTIIKKCGFKLKEKKIVITVNQYFYVY